MLVKIYSVKLNDKLIIKKQKCFFLLIQQINWNFCFVLLDSVLTEIVRHYKFVNKRVSFSETSNDCFYERFYICSVFLCTFLGYQRTQSQCKNNTNKD